MTQMPVLFIGHGSPMNAIEENPFSQAWKALGLRLPRPQAILCISAHWFTPGTRVSDASAPKMIYDMYGFPEELYKVVYPAPGSPRFALRAKGLISRKVEVDNSWGLDHGAWSVLRRVYPAADIPVFQLSVDRNASVQEHYQIGSELRLLRDEGVLILGSGNIVHNLGRVSWAMESQGYPWAREFDAYIKNGVVNHRHEDVIAYHRAGSSAPLAVPILDHYAPLLCVLGAAQGDQVSVFNESCVLGSLSMTSYLFEQYEG